MTPFSHVTVATCNAFQDRSTVLFWNKLHISVKLFFFFFYVFLLVEPGSPHRGALFVACSLRWDLSVQHKNHSDRPITIRFSVANNSLVISNLRCFCIQIILPLILQNSSVMWKAKKSNLMGCTLKYSAKAISQLPSLKCSRFHLGKCNSNVSLLLDFPLFLGTCGSKTRGTVGTAAHKLSPA